MPLLNARGFHKKSGYYKFDCKCAGKPITCAKQIRILLTNVLLKLIELKHSIALANLIQLLKEKAGRIKKFRKEGVSSEISFYGSSSSYT